MALSIRMARRCYAEDLRFTAHVRTSAVIDAFATVPRERFVGPGPWHIKSPMGPADHPADYWTTADADPRHVYHNALIALDKARGINNGQPSLWAALFDQFSLTAGAHVLHLDCGTGYYSAIAAEIVGVTGAVIAVEIDTALAERARAALAPWRQASVLNIDGSSTAFDPADMIIVSAGATHPLPAWLDALKPGGRLVLPMTTDQGLGGMLRVTRQSAGLYAARFLCAAGFIDFNGARDPDIGRRLELALARDRGASVKSLRRAPAEPDETCWLAGPGWWLSTADTAGHPSS
ncbi:MAG: methyltransferase [Azospirillaceae bacterium]|nr:methyltransferase [Azospirillaceae bacterium]